MKRSLRLFDVTCLGVNATIGSGIFALPDDLYRDMGGWSPAAFLLCGLALLPIALCYAEAAGRTDRTGGPYVYARDAFGARAGFAVGWLCFANAILSLAAVSAVAAAYLARLVPALAGPMPQAVGAAVIIVLFGGLNYVGARPGARVTAVFTLAKVAALLVLVAVAAPAMRPERFEPPPPGGLAGVGGALFVALFALQGFEVAPVPAGETVRARRAMPIAIVFSLLSSAAVYVVVQAVVVGTHPRLADQSDTPLADAALGVAPWLAVVVTAGGVLSTLGFVAGNALGAPRYAFAAAVDGHLPRALAAVHPRFATPHRAIVTTCLLAGALATVLDFRSLVGMSNVTVAAQYLMTCLAVPVLRRRLGPSGGFRVPGGVLVPILGAAVALGVFSQGSLAELELTAIVLCAGIAVAWCYRRR